MGNALIDRELDDLRVDQNQLDLFRCGVIQDAHDNGVGADRLTGTGRTGDDHMRQPGDVAYDGISGDVPSHRKRQLAPGTAETVALQDFPERNGVLVAVGDFDADGRLSGNGRLDADPLRCQRKGNVVCQSGDLGDLDAGGRLYLIPCDGRSPENPGDADGHAETFQRLYQNAGFFFHFLVYRRVSGTADAVLQKVDAGNLIGTCRRLGDRFGCRCSRCRCFCRSSFRIRGEQFRRILHQLFRGDDRSVVRLVLRDGDVDVHVIRRGIGRIVLGLAVAVPYHSVQIRGKRRVVLDKIGDGRFQAVVCRRFGNWFGRTAALAVDLCPFRSGLLREQKFRLFCLGQFRFAGDVRVGDIVRPVRLFVPEFPELAERPADIVPQLLHTHIQHPHNGDKEQQGNDDLRTGRADDPQKGIGENGADDAAALECIVCGGGV